MTRPGAECAQEMRGINFSFYTSDEIRTISVKKITSPIIVDGLNKPVPDGLYDPALGPLEQSDQCITCGEMYLQCPGHFGRIELAVPVFNPLLYMHLLRILKAACLYCHHFRCERVKTERECMDFEKIMSGTIGKVVERRSNKKTSLTSGQFVEAKKLVDAFVRGPPPKCQNCGAFTATIKSEGHGKPFLQPLSDKQLNQNMAKGIGLPTDFGASTVAAEASKTDGEEKSTIKDFNQMLTVNKSPRILLPSEVKQHMQLLWENEKRACCLFWGGDTKRKSKENRSHMFFLDVVAVTPSRLRPPNHVNDMLVEHPQNVLYGRVISANIALSDHIRSNNENNQQALLLWMNVQNAVNTLIDSTTGQGKDQNIGIRQILEKKTGLFRWNMMGKRVNYTCRSVISPDPYIAVNEVGIPPQFAKKLTYPERVTSFNVARLRQNVENGPDVHPGATHVEDENGVRTSLQHVKPYQRSAIAKTLLTVPGIRASTSSCDVESGKTVGKTVYRHLQDGDILLVNRQPTLHKPGVMGHVARIIQSQRALRLHYANCSTFNADFDGDEMNVHFPQDELARAEAYKITNANQQYVVPTSGDPIRGLIQDHIVSASLLTKRDTYFNKEEYQQLVYTACVRLPSFSSIRKGVALEVFEHDPMLHSVRPAILKPRRLWTGKQVLTTILNFVTGDRPPFSFNHGAKVTAEYLGKNSGETTVIVEDNELLCGIIDKAQFGKFGLVHSFQELYGADDAGLLLSVFSRLFTSYLQMHGFTCGIADMLLLPEAEVERTDTLKKAAAELGDHIHAQFVGLEKKEDVDIEDIKDQVCKFLQFRGDAGRARLDMLMSSALNKVTSQVNNAIFPKGLLKPFPDNCLALMTVTGAKGGMVNFTQISTLLGQQELEGKRVPRMVSGKSLPCFQPWEPVARSGGFISDRFLTGLRPQEYYFHCMAGRDGLVDTAVKTAKSGYLQRCMIKNLECLKIAYDFTVRDSDGSIVQFRYGEDGVDVTKKSCLTHFKLLSANRDLVCRKLGFDRKNLSKTGISLTEAPDSEAYIVDMPEALKKQFEEFLKKTPSKDKRLLKLKKDRHVSEFRDILKLKYFSSLAAPGEPVGVLAGQSIGEPSTQMTLNTFHFAGRGEMNVTLGIPRLHEILTVAAKKPKTPIMTCPMVPGKTREDADRLALRLRKLALADILQKVEFSVVPFHVQHGVSTRVYKVRLKLYPAERYPAYLGLESGEVSFAVNKVFARSVQKEIERQVSTLSKVSAKDSIQISSSTTDASLLGDDDGDDGEGDVDVGKKKGKKKVEIGEAAEEDDDDDEGDEEEGTDAVKRKGRSNDEAAYESEDEDDDGKKIEDVVMEEENDDGDDVDNDDDVEDDDDGKKNQKKKQKKKYASSKGQEEEGKGGEVIDEDEAADNDKTPSKSSEDTEGMIYNLEFSSDQSSPHIFLPAIVEKVLKGINIRCVKDIEKCAVIDLKNDSKKPALQTDGVNFAEMWELGEDLDLNKLTSNHVAQVLQVYGVEAARATIVSEVQGVFGSYGISVDVRHLGLIADFMTFQGGYRPCNRLGIVASTSPLLKMSFETASVFLVDATLKRSDDLLDTPSSRIVVGRTVDLGTGCFDLLQKVDHTSNV